MSHNTAENCRWDEKSQTLEYENEYPPTADNKPEWMTRGIVGDPNNPMSNPHIRITPQEREEIIAELFAARQAALKEGIRSGELAKAILDLAGMTNDWPTQPPPPIAKQIATDALAR